LPKNKLKIITARYLIILLKKNLPQLCWERFKFKSFTLI